MRLALFFGAVLASTLSFGVSDSQGSDVIDEVICQIKVLDIQYEGRDGEQEYRCVIDADQQTVNADMTYDVPLDDESVASVKTELESGHVYATIPGGKVLRGTASRNQILVRPGTKVKLSKQQPKGKKRSVKRHRRKNKPSTSRLLQVKKNGTSSVLVLRVSAVDHNLTLTAKELSNRIFGTFGDKVNLRSIYDNCSAGKLKFIPAVGDNIVDGVGEIALPQKISGMRSVDVDNLVVSLGNMKFGELSTVYDHVMICLPPGTQGKWIAYAYMNWYRSSYNDLWCGYPSTQVHEIGHNLGLSHSNENNDAYGDQSSLMGYSYGINEGPQMCFDGHKSWILGWYRNRQIDLHPEITGSWIGKLAAFVDYKSTSPKEYIVIKVGKLYLVYNRKKLFNSGTVEKADKVTITEGNNTRSTSNSLAGLGNGDSYRYEKYDGSNTVIIKVCRIFTDVVPNYVHINIFLEGKQDDRCDEDPSPTPSTKIPSPAPQLSRSPTTRRPSTVRPTRSPTRPSSAPQLSKSPTTSGPSSAILTHSPTRPSSPPSLRPTFLPTTSPPTTSPPTSSPTNLPTTHPTMSSSFPSQLPNGSPSISPSLVRSALPSADPLSQSPRIVTSAPSSARPTQSPTASPFVIIPGLLRTPLGKPSILPVEVLSASPSDSQERFVVCPINQTRFQLVMNTDQFPGETEWELTNARNTSSWNGGPYDGAGKKYVESMCVPDDLYTLSMKDKGGDGMCCKHGEGSYIVFMDGVEVVSGGDFGMVENSIIKPLCDNGDDELRVKITTDYFGPETSWMLETQLSGEKVMNGTGYKSWETRDDTKCLNPSLCYIFTIRDEWGDGMCCSYGFGGYSVQFAGSTYQGSFFDGYSEEVRIGASCLSPTIIDSVTLRRRQKNSHGTMVRRNYNSGIRR